ncbi:MAG: hypothetical protein JXR03_21390 [Cyclobacteriaceae bacterium]
MKKIPALLILLVLSVAGTGQTNKYPPHSNPTIFQSDINNHRGYDVTNINSHIVSRFEATIGGFGQLWLKDENGNFRITLAGSSTVPSSMEGELVIGEHTSDSKGRKLYVNGSSQFNGNLYFDKPVTAKGSFTLSTPQGDWRTFDIVNSNGDVSSRFECTNDGSGQLKFHDGAGVLKVAIRSNETSPSAIAGELIIGEFSTETKNRNLFVKGSSEFAGVTYLSDRVYGEKNFELKTPSGQWRAYDVRNSNGHIAARFECTTDGSGQLAFKDKDGAQKVAIRSSLAYPSAIAGELIIGEYDWKSKGKTLYVKGDSWLSGRLDIDGKVRSEEVKVEVFNWPDYVFDETYELRSLEETKEFISKNKHLPEIPSAKEAEADGIDLGDMNMKLLKKIEELTLYQIALLEKLEEQADRLIKVENQLEALKD